MKKKYIEIYGNAYELLSPNNDMLMEIFRKKCAENGIISDANECFQYLHAFPEKYMQMSFVDNLQ